MTKLSLPQVDRARAKWHLLSAGLIFLTLFVNTAAVAHAATLCVKPGGGGGCYATIAQAVTAASSGDTITIAAGTYTENSIALTKNLTLAGASAATTLVDANQLGRVFAIPVNISVTMRDLTLQNAKIQNEHGGAISNLGSLTLSNCAFKANQVQGMEKGGGAIYNKGTLVVTNCAFENNLHTATLSAPMRSTTNAPRTAGLFGGGAILSEGALTVTNGAFRLNTAEPTSTMTGSGGAIFSTGTLAVTNSTFEQNEAGCGGGIDNAGTGAVTGSTFYRNKGMH